MSGEDKKPVSFGDPATEPVDLAQAFKMYNEANRASAQDPVEEGSPAVGVGEAGDPGIEGSGSGDPEATDETLDTSAGTGQPEDSSDPGGSATVIEPIDYDSRRQEILTGIQKNAINQVRQDFAKNQIKLCTIEDLYQRDENSGRVTFKNPDDPTRDFASRSEAQQWVDAFNKQIEMRFRQEVNNKQKELVTSAAPTLRLIEFAPKYESMSKIEQDILDDLIEGYAVTDTRGQIIGYNIDLNAMAAQASKIAKRMPQQAQPEPDDPKDPKESAKQQSTPAMDMPTGNGKSVMEKEPESIGEALKMYDKMKREKGKK